MREYAYMTGYGSVFCQKSMRNPDTSERTIPSAMASAMRREKNVPRISSGTRSRIQELQLQWDTAEKHP